MPAPPIALTSRFDLAAAPVIGRLLRWRHARAVLQIPLLALGVVMVVHGLFGPSLSPKNLATVVTWVHFRGALVLVLLAGGNFFCFACPFMLVRDFARRFIRPRFAWPRPLRNKWLSVVLFVSILLAYEVFDLWASPWLTAWLIVAYFVTAVAVDVSFKHATFCKFLCPVGQFNFAAALASPLEVAVRNPDVCSACSTKDCIRGRRDSEASLRGCELALFLPQKAGNMDCTFCLDCLHACPHANVGILSRSPLVELTIDPARAGIGFFSRRKDLAALAIVFSFGALLNAFAMVSPAHVLERWIGGLLGLRVQGPIVTILFALFLVVEPTLLLGSAAWLTNKVGGLHRPLLPTAVRYSYTLVPLGFGMWLAHYGFHFFTGALTIVPVVQSAVASLGRPLLGAPLWTLSGLPLDAVRPLETGFLALGFAGSLFVADRMARADQPRSAWRVIAPWAAVAALLFATALWVLQQPMEMRATFLAG